MAACTPAEPLQPLTNMPGSPVSSDEVFVYPPVKHSIICHIVSHKQNGWSFQHCRRQPIGLPRLAGAMATANSRAVPPARRRRRRRQGRLRHPRPAEGPPRSAPRAPFPGAAACVRGRRSCPRPSLPAPWLCGARWVLSAATRLQQRWGPAASHPGRRVGNYRMNAYRKTHFWCAKFKHENQLTGHSVSAQGT